MKRLIMFFLLLAALVSVTAIIFAQDEGGLSGILIFNAIGDDGQEIEVMPIGSDVARNISNDPGVDIAQDISTDGTILFISDRDGEYELFTMDMNGENLIQLTNNEAVDSNARYSPDGAAIAFASDRDGQADIYVMDVNGENVSRLSNDEPREAALAWSPDGENIAFVNVLSSTTDEQSQYRFRTLELNIGFISTEGGDSEIVAENIAIRIHNSVNSSSNLAWSPDSSMILYRSIVDEADTELFTYNLQTGETTQLTDNDTEENAFAWTDEGKIIYSSFGGFRLYDLAEDSNAHLYIMEADGSNSLEIIAVENAYSPIQNLRFIVQTQKIIFERWTSGQDSALIDLWAVDLDGENLQNITNTPTVTEGAYFYFEPTE